MNADQMNGCLFHTMSSSVLYLEFFFILQGLNDGFVMSRRNGHPSFVSVTTTKHIEIWLGSQQQEHEAAW